MSNSRLQQFSFTYEAKTVKIYAKVSIGASGAPTLVTNANKGIVSISKTATGKYTLVLKDNFNRLLAAQMTSISATPSAAPDLAIVADNSNSTSPNLQIGTSLNGVAANPGNGEILLLELTMKDSSV